MCDGFIQRRSASGRRYEEPCDRPAVVSVEQPMLGGGTYTRNFCAIHKKKWDRR